MNKKSEPRWSNNLQLQTSSQNKKQVNVNVNISRQQLRLLNAISFLGLCKQNAIRLSYVAIINVKSPRLLQRIPFTLIFWTIISVQECTYYLYILLQTFAHSLDNIVHNAAQNCTALHFENRYIVLTYYIIFILLFLDCCST